MKRMNLTVVPFASAVTATAAVLLSIGATTVAQDQSRGRGRVIGRVVDLSDAVLPGVRVTLTAPRQPEREALTGYDGRFVFEDVQPYRGYTVSIELPGFISDTKESVVVTAGATSTADFTMELGCVPPDLVVTGLDAYQRLSGSLAVAHVRTTDAVVTRNDRCGPRRIATILEIASLSPVPVIGSSWPTAPSKGETINLIGESGRFQAQKEYLVVLPLPTGRKYPFFGAAWVREIVDGRMRGPADDELGLHAGMTLEEASRRLREVGEKANRER